MSVKCFKKIDSKALMRIPVRISRAVMVGVMFVFIAALIFVIFWFGGGSGDFGAYHRAVRRMRFAADLRSVPNWLPKSMGGELHNLLRQQFQDYNTVEAELLNSGFLTNLVICTPEKLDRVTNRVQSIDEISGRLHKALPNNDFIPFKLQRYPESNLIVVTVTCPTSDVAYLKGGL